MTSRLNIVIDKSVCVSNQACIATAPHVFRLDAEDKSEVFSVRDASEQEIIEAALNCPVSAIAVNDANTGEDLLDE